MRDLNFEVNGQALRKVGDFSGIVRGTKGYLRCRFEFKDSDWNNLTCLAVFESTGKESAVLIQKDRTCQVPDEITDDAYFKIRVVGAHGKTKQIITNKELITQGG